MSSQPWANSLELYITPWGFLKGAAENNATASRRKVDGKNYTVLTWSPAVKAPSGKSYVINGYVNDQNIVDRVETWLGDNIMGDMHDPRHLHRLEGLRRRHGAGEDRADARRLAVLRSRRDGGEGESGRSSRRWCPPPAPAGGPWRPCRRRPPAAARRPR